ncbi:hypothetical protein BX600DRAFT_518290 [Xylariales sp. PMI_506]|nr:hypothetical protein BX600DRAFT_518290 [Xylariales sp. PMI_506]
MGPVRQATISKAGLKRAAKDEVGDEYILTEKRRNQVRNAQRRYRQGKDDAIDRLYAHVERLHQVVKDISHGYLALFDDASRGPLDGGVAHKYKKLLGVAKRELTTSPPDRLGRIVAVAPVCASQAGLWIAPSPPRAKSTASPPESRAAIPVVDLSEVRETKRRPAAKATRPKQRSNIKPAARAAGPMTQESQAAACPFVATPTDTPPQDISPVNPFSAENSLPRVSWDSKVEEPMSHRFAQALRRPCLPQNSSPFEAAPLQQPTPISPPAQGFWVTEYHDNFSIQGRPVTGQSGGSAHANQAAACQPTDISMVGPRTKAPGPPSPAQTVQLSDYGDPVTYCVGADSSTNSTVTPGYDINVDYCLDNVIDIVMGGWNNGALCAGAHRCCQAEPRTSWMV